MIYFVQAEEHGFIKIGTTSNMRKRYDQLKKSVGWDLTLLGMMEGGFNEEQAIHRRFTAFRAVGEWYNDDPAVMDYIECNARAWDEDDDEPLRQKKHVLIQCSPQWREWLRRLTDHDRCSATVIIERALNSYAKEIGFEERAPRR